MRYRIHRQLLFPAVLSVFMIGGMISDADSTPQHPRIVIVPSGCSEISVWITDSVVADQGLRGVELLFDSAGIYTAAKLVSFNVGFDGIEPPDYYFNMADSFRVKVLNPTEPAYAAFWAVNGLGRDVIAEWHYSPPPLKQNVTDIIVLTPPVGSDSCFDFTLLNQGDSNFTMESMSGPQRSGLTMDSVRPAVPGILLPGNLLGFRVCFHASDTVAIRDTIFVTTGCYRVPFPLFVQGRAPLIDAEDLAFNGVDTGATQCKPLRVWNRGNDELTLSPQLNAGPFTFQSATFPDHIPPYSYHDYSVCFSPRGSYGTSLEDISWTTNEPAIYQHGSKDVSHLTGTAGKAGLHWDRTQMTFDPAHDTTLIFNIAHFSIYNTASSPQPFDSLRFTGPNASEFVLQSYLPHGTIERPTDTIKVDIQWQSEPPITLIRRTATLYIISGGIARDSLFLTGLLPTISAILPVRTQTTLELYPNPNHGGTLHVIATKTLRSISILDVLGRAVWTGSHEMPLAFDVPTLSLPTGEYYLRAEFEDGIVTRRVEIVR